jgi:hypothetical protein
MINVYPGIMYRKEKYPLTVFSLDLDIINKQCNFYLNNLASISNAKKFLAEMHEEQSKNPGFSFTELLEKWNTRQETAN